MSTRLSETGLFDGCYPSGVEPHDIRFTCDAVNLRDGAQRLWTPVLVKLSDGLGGVQPEIERSRLAANADLAVLDPLREDDPLKVISKEMPEYMSVLTPRVAAELDSAMLSYEALMPKALSELSSGRKDKMWRIVNRLDLRRCAKSAPSMCVWCPVEGRPVWYMGGRIHKRRRDHGVS